MHVLKIIMHNAKLPWRKMERIYFATRNARVPISFTLILNIFVYILGMTERKPNMPNMYMKIFNLISNQIKAP